MVALYNPETKQAIQCKPDPWASWDVIGEAEACAKGYEKLGWQRVQP